MKLESPNVLMTAMPEQGHGAIRSQRYRVALVLAVIAWLLVWYWETALSMEAIWHRSQTFAHGYLIVPISAWLVWRRRHGFAALDLRPNFKVLPILAALGFGWMLAQLADVNIVKQYCIVLMIPVVVWAMLGAQCVRYLAFPLFFLLFAVPVGEFLLPPLMEQTADFTIAALRLSGIPVYREGLFFTVPSGSWSVEEACSGLRYLVASLTLGFLYSYLTYRSLTKRIVFIAASIFVPLVANWLRAYMIVMIGHLSNMRYAVGVDHLLYGWVFFGIVITALFWAASYWRDEERSPQDLPAQAATSRAVPPSPALTAVAAASAALVLMVWPVAASYFETPYPGIPELKTPVGAWQPVSQTSENWQPRFGNPRSELRQDYLGGNGPASLYIGYFRNQRSGFELISSQNKLVSNKSQWRIIQESTRSVLFGSKAFDVIESKLRSPSMHLLAWHFYWIDGRYTTNPYAAKLLQAKSKLFGRRDDAAVVVVYTNLDADKIAANRLHEFIQAMLPGITRSLEDER